MKHTIPELRELLREHGYLYIAKKYKSYYKSAELRSICYQYHVGALPEYQYPQTLKKHLSEGLLPSQIAKLYGVDFSIIYNWMRKHKIPVQIKPFTEEEDKYIRFNAGYISVQDMSTHLKRPERSIYHRMQVLNIKITAAIGYTVQQLSRDLKMNQTLIRSWMLYQGLQKAETPGTYRISVDETLLYEWLMQGNIYRIREIAPDQHMLREIKAECDQLYVSAKEIDRLIGKWVCSNKQKFPEKLMIIREHNLGALYLREEVYKFFWERRRMLDIKKIPADLTYWITLCEEWDRIYIYREEISKYIDYAASGGWYAYETKKHGFPAPAGDNRIKYYSRAAVLEYCKKSGKHPRLTQYLEEQTQ